MIEQQGLQSLYQDLLEIEPPDEGILLPEDATPKWAKKSLSCLFDPGIGSKWSWAGIYMAFSGEDTTEDPHARIVYYLTAPEPFLRATQGSSWGEGSNDEDHIFEGAWLLHQAFATIPTEVAPSWEGQGDYTLFANSTPVGVFSLKTWNHRKVPFNVFMQALVHHMVQSGGAETTEKAQDLADTCFPALEGLQWSLVMEM